MAQASSPPAASTAPLTPAMAYWRKTRRLTVTLLSIWFLVTFGAVYFARTLDRVTLFGWPLSFYMAAQGAMLIYLLIVITYTVCMRRIEQQLQTALQTENEHSHGE